MGKSESGLTGMNDILNSPCRASQLSAKYVLYCRLRVFSLLTEWQSRAYTNGGRKWSVNETIYDDNGPRK